MIAVGTNLPAMIFAVAGYAAAPRDLINPMFAVAKGSGDPNGLTQSADPET